MPEILKEVPDWRLFHRGREADGMPRLDVLKHGKNADRQTIATQMLYTFIYGTVTYIIHIVYSTYIQYVEILQTHKKICIRMCTDVL